MDAWQRYYGALSHRMLAHKLQTKLRTSSGTRKFKMIFFFTKVIDSSIREKVNNRQFDYDEFPTSPLPRPFEN